MDQGKINKNDFELLKEIQQKYPQFQISIKNPDPARLLVADDEPGIAQLVMDLLEPAGLEVCPASNGEDALRVFKEHRCNLALIDLRMPKMHGTELLRLLEGSVDPPPPKAILVMCAGLGENLDELKRLGHEILSKPLDLEGLEGTVLKACKKYGLDLKRLPI